MTDDARTQGTTPAADGRAKRRLTWLDANRVFAAVGVVLIHSTTDSDGQPFASRAVSERSWAAGLRIFSELSGSEIFLLFSMFLLAMKLSKGEHSYRDVVADQARKLFVPYLAWTAFYAFFRLAKAHEFGYGSAIVSQLWSWQSWPKYILLGTTQYHLHFIPTLFGLVLMYPLYRSALRYPTLGASLIGCLYVLSTGEGWLWSHVTDPSVRDYLVRALKIGCYTGYAMVAFALFGAFHRGMSQEVARDFRNAAVFLVGLAFIATIPYAGDIALAARWPLRPGAGYYAHFLMPAFVFAAFLGAQYANFSPRFSQLSKFTFGVYLVHPIVIDLCDIALHRLDLLSLHAVALIITKFAVAVPVAFGISYLLSRTPLLAWSIGLQERAPKAAASAPKPARISVASA